MLDFLAVSKKYYLKDTRKKDIKQENYVNVKKDIKKEIISYPICYTK